MAQCARATDWGGSVVAHTIPFSEFFDGLLGMDILTLFRAQINVPQQIITLED